jgi:Hemerythrin HHE cation binding domain
MPARHSGRCLRWSRTGRVVSRSVDHPGQQAHRSIRQRTAPLGTIHHQGLKAREYQMSKEQPIDVRDMAIIHRTFRAGYAEAARLVRAASTPSPRRVKFLADHIDLAIAALHIHHESEDELLYPKLIQRAPEQAPMTEEVEHEHHPDGSRHRISRVRDLA